MKRLKKRTLLTVVGTVVIVGGLLRLALNDEVVEVAMPDGPADAQDDAQDDAPLMPNNLAALAAER
jgi:hypothetical protein